MAIAARVRDVGGDQGTQRRLCGSEKTTNAQHNLLSCGACASCADTCGNPACPHCDTKSKNNGANPCSIFDYENTRYFTICQIRRHNSEQSAWLVVGDDIYDATEYIHSHPGGKNSILKKAGGCRDCTEDLKFHSKAGRKMWRKYHVGKVRKCPSQVDMSSDRQWWMFWA